MEYFKGSGSAACKYTLELKEFINPNGLDTFSLSHYSHCLSKNSVYVTLCLCNSVHMGSSVWAIKNMHLEHSYLH